MEGVYEPLYSAADSAPNPHMKPFVAQLQETVRSELASSAAAVRLGPLFQSRDFRARNTLPPLMFGKPLLNNVS